MRKKIILGIGIFGTVLVFSFIYYRVHTREVNVFEGTSASIIIKGSDTAELLVSDLAKAFEDLYEGSDIAVIGGGSDAGIAALIAGEADFANSSIRIQDSDFPDANIAGRIDNVLVIARDRLSVIVSSGNRIRTLSLEVLGKMYRREITNWNQVGGNDAPIVLYGRQNAAGTYAYSGNMRNLESDQAIVDAVKSDVNGIGYVGLGYVADEQGEALSGVRAVSIEVAAGAISPFDTVAVQSGAYPLSRPLNQYLASMPRKGSMAEHFLRFEVSDAGKEIVKKAGFLPLLPSDEAINDALFEKIAERS